MSLKLNIDITKVTNLNDDMSHIQMNTDDRISYRAKDGIIVHDRTTTEHNLI